MRRARFKGLADSPVAYFHCVSRVVGLDFVFGDPEKERFVALMRIYERFCGLRVLSYCVMSNHFHILVEVPRRPEESPLFTDDAALVEHVRGSLGDKPADGLAWELGHFRAQGDAGVGAVTALKERWLARMWDISAFMKTLKQRFTQWFNGRHKRRGTLWEDRFRSVLVQGEGQALRTMAAYIDLNPVRAGICEDPKDYRWCGYAEAVGGAGRGGRLARAALEWLTSLSAHGGMKTETHRPRTTREVMERWRCHLFGVPESEAGRREEAAKGERAAQVSRRRISREKALEVLASGGRLSQADYLRCRVRYFTDGGVIGTKDFVERVFEATRERFSAGRQSGSRRLRGLELEKKPERLYNLRDLRRGVFG